MLQIVFGIFSKIFFLVLLNPLKNILRLLVALCARRSVAGRRRGEGGRRYGAGSQWDGRRGGCGGTKKKTKLQRMRYNGRGGDGVDDLDDGPTSDAVMAQIAKFPLEGDAASNFHLLDIGSGEVGFYSFGVVSDGGGAAEKRAGDGVDFHCGSAKLKLERDFFRTFFEATPAPAPCAETVDHKHNRRSSSESESSSSENSEASSSEEERHGEVVVDHSRAGEVRARSKYRRHRASHKTSSKGNKNRTKNTFEKNPFGGVWDVVAGELSPVFRWIDGDHFHRKKSSSFGGPSANEEKPVGADIGAAGSVPTPIFEPLSNPGFYVLVDGGLQKFSHIDRQHLQLVKMILTSYRWGSFSERAWTVWRLASAPRGAPFSPPTPIFVPSPTLSFPVSPNSISDVSVPRIFVVYLPSHTVFCFFTKRDV